ncbi:MAG: hydrogenase formation protein HypD [Pseudomonadota bacterium]
MKYVAEFRNKDHVLNLQKQIMKYDGEALNIMEVCGTHTMNIAKFGIRNMIPKHKINLVSGPGCPVCVTPIGDIEAAISLAKDHKKIITTFGDMMKVPGVDKNLFDLKSEGSDVRIVYSTIEALKLAKENPEREIVFMGVGFETTVPTIAATIKRAKEENVNNFSVIAMNKTVPIALGALMSNPAIKLNAMILPGHVSAIIGEDAYRDVFTQYNSIGIITGFEPVDIMRGILTIVEKVMLKENGVFNVYKRGVNSLGNQMAQKIVNEVYEPCDSYWRGVGVIPQTGLKIRESYNQYDATIKFNIEAKDFTEPAGCICGNILQGLNNPKECKHFGKSCTPEKPIGPCMVSSEGTCAAYYKYML